RGRSLPLDERRLYVIEHIGVPPRNRITYPLLALVMIRRAVMCLALVFIAIDGTAADRASLEKAQSLAWAKKFEDAARIYLGVLRDDPASRDARLGLARVRLWQGRYAEARDLFEILLARN